MTCLKLLAYSAHIGHSQHPLPFFNTYLNYSKRVKELKLIFFHPRVRNDVHVELTQVRFNSACFGPTSREIQVNTRQDVKKTYICTYVYKINLNVELIKKIGT